MPITSPDFNGSLEEFGALADNEFSQEWKSRYLQLRAQMIPDVARWLRLLHFFHPRRLEDHWQDQFGNPLPKLYRSEGLSVEIYNWCRPIIEVYGSLLAGQKPMPFILDVPPLDPEDIVGRYLADSQEKVLMAELYRQKVPLHFFDFCTSVVLFGIGYVCSWIDTNTGKLRTQALPWPGDVLPQWGSDRYGSGADSMESVIITERVSLDAARRLYPDTEFLGAARNIADLRYDGQPNVFGPNVDSILLLKIWWRWNDDSGKEQVGYAVVAFDGVAETQNSVLYRKDESGYPDIPVRWATRFNTPMEAPHRGAGVLDDIIGINTEYNEKLSALADMVMKLTYIKYKAKGFPQGKAPRLSQDSNMYALSFNQDIEAIAEQVNNVPFDNFLSRLETMMFTISGLSRLMMGSLPPGGDSGEALQNLLHAAIGRLEGVRTPIMWAWMGLFDEIWVPLMRDQYRVKGVDTAGKFKSYSLKQIFSSYNRCQFIWPDVTPRDQLRAMELAMNLHKSRLLSREGAMTRAQIASPIDEMDKIRRESADTIMNPQDVTLTANAEQAKLSYKMMVGQAQNPVLPRPQVKVSLKGDLSPEEVQSAAQAEGIQGAAPLPQPTPAGAPGQAPQGPQQPQNPQQAQQQQMKSTSAAQDMVRKLQANQTPTKTPAQNAPPQQVGSETNAIQGLNNGNK